MENSMETPQKIKNRITMWSSYSSYLGMYSKNMKTLIQKDVCMPRFFVALFTIAKYGNNLSIQ